MNKLIRNVIGICLLLSALLAVGWMLRWKCRSTLASEVQTLALTINKFATEQKRLPASLKEVAAWQDLTAPHGNSALWLQWVYVENIRISDPDMVPLVFVESSGLVCGEGGFVLFKAGGFSWFGASDFERFLQDPVLHTKEVYWMLSEEQRSKLDEIRERVVVADGRSSGPGTERSGRFDANP